MLTIFKNLLANFSIPTSSNSTSFTAQPRRRQKSIYPKPGEQIGDYTVRDLAGPPGGTAVVLICTDRSGRELAVKRFYPEKTTPVLKDRVKEEISLGLNGSRYLVAAESCFEDRGYFCSVMPYVQGDTLQNVLEASGPVNEEDSLFTTTCIAEATREIHNRNIISTDIKPGNVIISKQDSCPKLIDLSSFERPGAMAASSWGTMPYAAPELIGKKCLSKATDTYSIGVLLFEMIVGSERFCKISERWEDNLRMNIKPDTSSIRRTHPGVSRIVEKALEIDPKDRYTDAKSLIAALDACNGQTVKHSRKFVLVNGRRKIEVPLGRNIVGRNLFAPGNFYISEEQFETELSDRLMFRSISFKNKTYVNGMPVSSNWLEIQGNDVIQIANVKLKVAMK